MATNPFTYFVNIKAANAEIERLTAETGTLTANYAVLVEQFDAGKLALAAKDAEIVDLQAKLAAKAVTDKAAFDSAVEIAASAKALTIVAAAGTVPIKTQPATPAAPAGTKTRAEFEQMRHSERNAFIRAGGKLTH